jgi:hypothetical protein
LGVAFRDDCGIFGQDADVCYCLHQFHLQEDIWGRKYQSKEERDAPLIENGSTVLFVTEGRNCSQASHSFALHLKPTLLLTELQQARDRPQFQKNTIQDQQMGRSTAACEVRSGLLLPAFVVLEDPIGQCKENIKTYAAAVDGFDHLVEVDIKHVEEMSLASERI